MLSSIEYFSLGVYTAVFIYFIYVFFLYKEEKYNLYYSVGCLVAIIRIVVVKKLLVISISDGFIYQLTYSLYYLSYIWGGVFLVLIAENLFKEERLNHVKKGFIGIAMVFTVFIIFSDVLIFGSMDAFYDYSVVTMLVYTGYIYIKAVLKKRKRAVILCIGNLIMCFGIFFDILVGSNVFNSPIREIAIYTYFPYLILFSYGLSQNTKDYQQNIFKSELNFLHAQIKPHFLYNTITAISTYCREDPNVARELLIDLSTYLRGKFEYDREDMNITLKDEINLIKAYLAIEKVRFGNRLEVVYDIDQSIDIPVPCLIFQPLVENAVKHGLKESIKGIRVDIKVRMEENNVCLQVKDNGKGIDKNILSKILNQESSGIGISNTIRRLKMCYNTNLHIESIANEGTCMTIKIPAGGVKNVKMHHYRR